MYGLCLKTLVFFFRPMIRAMSKECARVNLILFFFYSNEKNDTWKTIKNFQILTR